MSNEAINIIEEYILSGEQKGETYLTLLASKGFGKACEMLIPRMYNETINTITKTNNTALTLAADKKLTEVCKKLIPRMSNDAINIIDNKHKDSALKKAIRNDIDEVAQMLIPGTSNDNIYVIDKYSENTLLITAAKKGMKTVCKMLISRMPLELINHINNAGDTAASIDTENFKEVFDLLQEKQEEFLKTITIAKQDIENSLKDLESVFNTNKKTLDVLFEKIQKLGDDKAALLKLDKQIGNITNNNIISKKLIDLDNYVNCLVDNQKTQDDTSKILGGVEGVPLE